jgi:class 3 adenylate cyclase
MQCPQCVHKNPAGSSFCLECGARLDLKCGSCGTDLPAGSKFCNKCGTAVSSPTASQPRFASPESYTPKHLAEKILTSKSALEDERKQVTILFADLKGSMELLADRDPEEARKLLDPVLERMMEAVHRYEGTVNQVMGDGIMALLGAPLAHEDHAVRACYAALWMQEIVKKYAEEVRRSHAAVVKIRIGLNSGEVVVRAIGSDLHMDYTAVGQTTHLAARMEQLADPGAIVITPETLALAEGYVEVKSLRAPRDLRADGSGSGPDALAGRGPPRPHTLRGPRRRGRAPAPGPRPGRSGPRPDGCHRWRGRRGQVTAHLRVHPLTSSAGLVDSGSLVCLVRQGHQLPARDRPAEGLFQDQRLGQSPGDARQGDGAGVGSRPGARAPAAPTPRAARRTGRRGSWQALDPAQRRQRTLKAVKHLLLRESQSQPLLVVFEDLHWIDAETQALLDSLVESLPPARLLLLVNYRPDTSTAGGGRPTTVNFGSTRCLPRAPARS